jgi:hypothetical protein
MKIELGDMPLWDGFKPYTLPDAGAGSVEDMRGVYRLLTNRDIDVFCISRVQDVDSTTKDVSSVLFTKCIHVPTVHWFRRLS